MCKAICPGSFDPVTNGHLDIFKRASRLYDEVVVAIFYNPGKGTPWFTVEERLEMLRAATKDIPNIRIEAFSGLLNVYAEQQKINVIVRGLRTFADFEYEFQRALLIKKIDEDLETMFMMTAVEHSYLSSSGIRELLSFNGDISQFVPECVLEMLEKRKRNNKALG